MSVTTRLRKEARALLPTWAGILLVMLAPFVLGAERAPQLAALVLAFGCALLGGESFGHELQHGTLGALMAQPVARAAIWREKMIVLAAAVVTACAAFVGLVAPNAADLVSGPLRLPNAMLAMLPLAALCGAPYLTLLTRSGLGGAVISVSIPAMLMLGANTVRWLVVLGAGPIPGVPVSFYCAVTAVCCGLAYRQGYATFMRLEVRDAAARTLGMPRWLEASVSRRARGLSTRFAGPFARLLGKELRLQQGVFVLAGVQYVAAVALAVGLRQADYRDWGKVVVVLSASYLSLIPLLAGALAVAEERRWGIAEWQLSLPPSALRQWLAKVLVGLSVSLVLGFLIPVALLLAGRRAFGVGSAEGEAATDLGGLLVVVALAHLALTSVVIYAATVAGSTVHAVLLGLGIAVGIVLVHLAAGGLSLRVAAVELVILLGVVQRFAFANYRRPGVGVRTLGLQGLGVGALVFAFAGMMWLR